MWEKGTCLCNFEKTIKKLFRSHDCIEQLDMKAITWNAALNMKGGKNVVCSS